MGKLVIKFHIGGVKFHNLRHSSRPFRLLVCQLKLVNISLSAFFVAYFRWHEYLFQFILKIKCLIQHANNPDSHRSPASSHYPGC